MNRNPGLPATVVVALTGPAPPHLEAGLARFAEEAGPLGEVVVVDASKGREGLAIAPKLSNVRAILRPAGELAPELWREGLLASGSEFVALTTAQMIPSRGWLEALLARLRQTGAAGVGGPIEPARNLGPTDRAVALLRYANYFPMPAGVGLARVAPPGDNALYRRSALMSVGASWLGGFWEVEVHEALRRGGDSLAMTPAGVVTFAGGAGLGAMVPQRFRHGRRYGLGRSAGLGAGARLARVAASPLVPPLLGARIARALRARGMSPAPWIASLPSLVVLASAWAVGEAAGTWTGERTRGTTTRLMGEAA